MNSYYDSVTEMLVDKSVAYVHFTDDDMSMLFMQQYAYHIYSKYDVIWYVQDQSDIFHELFEDSNRVLLFSKRSTANSLRLLQKVNNMANVRLIVFMEYPFHVDTIIPRCFYIEKKLSVSYIEYLSQHITQENKKKILLESGNSFHNIARNIENLNTQNTLNLNNQTLVSHDPNTSILIESISFFSVAGVHKDLIRLFLSHEQLVECISKNILFYNDGYFIPNVDFLSYPSKISGESYDFFWKKMLDYVQTLVSDKDKTLLAQLNHVLSRFIENCNDLQESVSWRKMVYDIEGKLFVPYRFTYGEDCLTLLKNIQKLYSEQNDPIESAALLSDQAVIYADKEKFELSERLFLRALKMCENSNQRMFSHIMDDYSRFLDKQARYADALKKLEIVERFYRDTNDKLRLNNVLNRIALNLSNIGRVLEAMEYLKELHYVEYRGEMRADDIFSCEVANNLSICYLESGKYTDALAIMDSLYRLYLDAPNTPADYANDILQNRGCVFLYQKRYREAQDCFDQALADSVNPYSTSLTMENYMYAKALAEKAYDESISFFESQVSKSTDPETHKMLAELYYYSGDYSQCLMYCQSTLERKENREDERIKKIFELIIFKCRLYSNKVGFIYRIKSIKRLKNDLNYWLRNTGDRSFYYVETKHCLEEYCSLALFGNCSL